jgi:RHS repeat-associated protein
MRREHDAAQRITATIDPLNRRSEATYDDNSRPIESKDPLNRVTKSSWTSRGETSTTTDALNKNTTQLYDPNGNRLFLTNRRGKNYTFAYDTANRPTSTTTPTGKVTLMTYWNNNLAKTITEPSLQTTTLAYNAKNLVSTKTDPTGTITYGYDNSGLLTTVTEGTAVITRTYDERGRLKTYTNADSDLLQYQYDANNNLTRITYPPDASHPAGKQVNYTYNSRNLLETVTDWNNRVTTYQYDRLGRLTGITRPNGTSASLERDAADQLTSIHESSGGKLISYLAFQYDAASQIKKRFRAPLVQSGWQHPTFTGTYDDDNRLATVNGQTVTHDADGNMTNGPIRHDSGNLNLAYNSRNQLTSADGLTYTYDAEGRRRTVIDTSGTIRDVIDPSGSLSRLLIRHNADTTKTYYVYGLGLLYEVDGDENTKTHHYDQVGSTIARTDDTGKVIGKAEYSAYGICFWKQGDMMTPFLYNGQAGVQTDANGLLNMRARYYSPYLMRFLNADPIGFSGGLNWFAYADGNPISKADPFGLVAETVWDVVNLGIGGASFGYNIGQGNYWSAALDGVGLAYDATATAVPFLPAGASAGIKAYRAGNTATDAVRVAHDVAVVSDKTHDAARAIDTTASTVPWQAAIDGSQLHRQVASETANSLRYFDSTYMAGANRASGIRPDMIGGGVWGDITTAGQWQRHANHYSNFGQGIPILYQRGTGVIGTTRLRAGASAGSSLLQGATGNGIFGGWSGNK